jgi:hemerythrin-like metal-binding protein
MAFITWTDELSVGVELFDNDHKELISLANRLHDSITVRAQQGIMSSLLNDLLKYTIFHFGHEEGFMLQYGYPGYKKHKMEHEGLVKKVEDYIEQVSEGKTSISLSLMGFLKEWLVNHIMGSDKEYVDFFAKKGIS